MTLQQNKERRLIKPKPPQIKCWIIWRPTQTPTSGIMLQTWYCTSTVMHLTFQFQTHASTWEVFFCGDKSPNEDNTNGSILNVASVIKNVVASAAESEVGACFQNAQSGAPLRITLDESGQIQPPTPLHTYNSTAFGILNETIRHKRSKAMDMRYHWLTDRVRQKQFDIYWRPGRENLGDCHTRHHSAQHHRDMHRLILQQANSLQVLRGCVKLRPLPQLHLCARIYVETNPSAQRATQLRSVLARVCSVSRPNLNNTTVP
jgi:hypothetical protein